MPRMSIGYNSGKIASSLHYALSKMTLICENADDIKLQHKDMQLLQGHVTKFAYCFMSKKNSKLRKAHAQYRKTLKFSRFTRRPRSL